MEEKVFTPKIIKKKVMRKICSRFLDDECYKLIKTKDALDGNCLQYESQGDKN